MPPTPQRKGAGKSKGPCAGASKHREAQNKYVQKNKAKHKAAVKRTYQKNKGKILAQKKAARKSGGARKGGARGRPRKC